MEYFSDLFNHNYNKIHESDWLSTGPILTQKGECMPHACNWSVLDNTRHFVYTLFWTDLEVLE